MSWFTMFTRFRRETKLVDLAEIIASRSRHAVWQRVCQRAPHMNVSEARGYIRARAANIVHFEVDQIVKDHLQTVTEEMRPRLIQMSTDAVVRLVSIESQLVAPSIAHERAA